MSLSKGQRNDENNKQVRHGEEKPRFLKTAHVVTRPLWTQMFFREKDTHQVITLHTNSMQERELLETAEE